MKPLSSCHLYTFVDTAYLHGRTPTMLAKELCDGGSDLIQLRAKGSSKEEIRRMAEEVAVVTHRAGVHLVINDHLDVAQALGAGFCHLGQEDFFDAGYKKTSELPNHGLVRIGLSTHAPDQAGRAVAAGADYLAIGPIYATDTKPTAAPVTLQYVRWASANLTLPWFAIGGITLRNLDQVLAAGATRICVVSAILNSHDIAKTCSEFRKRILSRAP